MENWKDKRILIAEDEFYNFVYISALLEETEIQITHAENGKIAVDYCKNEYFDLVLMDIKMPIMTGIEATISIREFNADLVIIAQTAYAFKREECIEQGFTDYIAKPYNNKQLLTMIGKYFF